MPNDRALPPALLLPAVALTAVLLGALTSVGQATLPDALRPVANSFTSWVLVAFVAALAARPPWASAVAGTLALAGLVAGYEAASQVRLGFGMSGSALTFWTACALTVGPALGLLVAWARRDPATGRSICIGLVACVAVGEGITGLAGLREPAPLVWSSYLVGGVVAAWWWGVRGRGWGRALLTVATVVTGAVAFGVLTHVVGPGSI